MFARPSVLYSVKPQRVFRCAFFCEIQIIFLGAVTAYEIIPREVYGVSVLPAWLRPGYPRGTMRECPARAMAKSPRCESTEWEGRVFARGCARHARPMRSRNLSVYATA